MKYKNILKDKRGALALPMVPVVLIFLIAVMMCLEYFIMVSSFNDIQLIMDMVANTALRHGVKHEYHKDESIVAGSTSTDDTIDEAKIREKYAELLYANLDKSIARFSLKNTKENFVLMRPPSGSGTGSYEVDSTFKTNPGASKVPIITLKETDWSHTYSTNTKKLDTVVLDAVAKVNLKTSKLIPNETVKYTLTKKVNGSSSSNKNTTFSVEVNKGEKVGYVTLIIRSSTRMILK